MSFYREFKINTGKSGVVYRRRKIKSDDSIENLLRFLTVVYDISGYPDITEEWKPLSDLGGVAEFGASGKVNEAGEKELVVAQAHLYFDYQADPYSLIYQESLKIESGNDFNRQNIKPQVFVSKDSGTSRSYTAINDAYNRMYQSSVFITESTEYTWRTSATYAASNGSNYGSGQSGTLLFILSSMLFNRDNVYIDPLTYKMYPIKPQNTALEIEIEPAPAAGTSLGSYCGYGADRFTYYTNVADGRGGVVPGNTVTNSPNCGYKPAGTLMGQVCATPLEVQFQSYDLLNIFSTGEYTIKTVTDANGNPIETVEWRTYKELAVRNSPECGYITNGNVTFASPLTGVSIKVTGKGVYNLGTYGGFKGGIYSYTATKAGYAPYYGKFIVSQQETRVDISLQEIPNVSIVNFYTFPPLSKIYKVNGSTLTYQGITNSGKGITIPANTSVDFLIKRDGYYDEQITVRGGVGEEINRTVSLRAKTENEVSSSYEVFLVNPQTFSIFDIGALSHAFDISVAKSLNGVGSLNFSVPLGMRDFEDAITTLEGQAGVLVYLNGQPFTQVVIQNYSPVGEGLTRVECVEVLKVLSEEVREGNTEVSNILSEFKPSRTGVSDSADPATAAAFWGKYGTQQSYFYAYDGGLKLSESGGKIISAVANSNFLVNKSLNNNRAREYVCVFGRASLMPEYFYYIFDETKFDGAISNSTLGIRGRLDKDSGRLYVEANPSGTSYAVLAQSQEAITPFTIDGNNISVREALDNGDVEVRFSYKESEDGETVILSAFLTLNLFGVKKVISIPEVRVASATYITPLMVNQAGVFLKEKQGISYYYLKKTDEQTLFDWLKEVAPRFNWILDSGENHPMNKTALRIAFSNGDSWQFVEKILELAGNVSLSYAGIIDNKPSYVIYNTDKLPTLRKYLEGKEIYDVSYQKDFSDTYNVLVVNTSSAQEGETISVTNNLRVVIQPTEAKLNSWLGRTKKKIITANGFKDITSLTEYAYALYEENSEPSEPIDFKALVTDEWTTTIPGQPVEVFGLPEGKKVKEQIVNLSYNESSNEVSIELGKRKSLASAIMEAFNTANSY